MRIVTLAFIAVAVCGIPAQSAVIRVRPKIMAALNPDFTPVDPALIMSSDPGGILLRPGGSKVVVQVDFLMTIDDFQANQLGFGMASFNVNMSDDFRQSEVLPGWTVDTSSVDSNGSRMGGTVLKWADNQDSGPDTTDLQGILIATDPKSFFTGEPPGTDDTTDPRRNLGAAPFNNPGVDVLGNPITPHDDGEYVGTIFVEFESTPGLNGSISSNVTSAATYDAALDLIAAGNDGTGGSIFIEVDSTIFDWFGDTDRDGDVDITDLNNVRNNFGGMGLGDTDGDGRVTITDLNEVRNSFGLGSGANPVPEPPSLLLLAAGAAGLALLRRRKGS